MILRAEHLIKKYKSRTVVKDVSVQVEQGEIVGLLGPNGAGKTTSFYMIVGLITPNGGRIFLDDQEITKEPVYKRAQLGVGYLAQEASVFRRLSVEDNIRAVLEMTKMTKEEQKELERIQKEKNKKQEQRKAYGDVTAKVSELENQLKNLQSQAESLQGSKAEEQSKKAAGEASVLTDAEKQGITSSQQAAKLTLSQSADSLAEAKAGIQAEFDGIVTSTEVAAGSAVQEGAPMFSIADASKMCVDFKVSKYNLTNLEAGQKVTITSLDRKYQGSVTNIGKVAEKNEQGVAMATARVHIDDPDDHLIIGLDAKLKIELGKKTDVLKVPIAAVNSDSKGDFVYVFSKDKLQKKYVKTGISSKKNIEIIEGLKEGEKVVTTIDTTIEDGMKAAEKK